MAVKSALKYAYLFNNTENSIFAFLTMKSD